MFVLYLLHQTFILIVQRFTLLKVDGNQKRGVGKDIQVLYGIVAIGGSLNLNILFLSKTSVVEPEPEPEP